MVLSHLAHPVKGWQTRPIQPALKDGGQHYENLKEKIQNMTILAQKTGVSINHLNHLLLLDPNNLLLKNQVFAAIVREDDHKGLRRRLKSAKILWALPRQSNLLEGGQ